MGLANPGGADYVAARTETGLALWMDRLATVGAPLATGLLTLTLAVCLSVLIYFSP